MYIHTHISQINASQEYWVTESYIPQYLHLAIHFPVDYLDAVW